MERFLLFLINYALLFLRYLSCLDSADLVDLKNGSLLAELSVAMVLSASVVEKSA